MMVYSFKFYSSVVYFILHAMKSFENSEKDPFTSFSLLLIINFNK